MYPTLSCVDHYLLVEPISEGRKVTLDFDFGTSKRRHQAMLSITLALQKMLVHGARHVTVLFAPMQDHKAEPVLTLTVTCT